MLFLSKLRTIALMALSIPSPFFPTDVSLQMHKQNNRFFPSCACAYCFFHQVRMHCGKYEYKHNSPPSCFTILWRYGTKNKAIIHSAHAFVLILMLRASAAYACAFACACSCACTCACARGYAIAKTRVNVFSVRLS